MFVTLCFDGIDDEALVRAAQPFLKTASRIESWCAYGDVAQRLLDDVAARHHAPPPRHHHPTLDVEQAEAIANRGAGLLSRAGFAATAKTLCGRDPGHALVQASGTHITLVLAAGHRAGVGPKSVGHTARFVIDHARGPLLLLRIS